MANTEPRYLPQKHGLSNFSNYAAYRDTKATMESGKQYMLVAETNGIFSNQAQPDVESDKCILLLTDETSYTQIISDSTTAQGTVFTWNGPTGTYWLGVNVYHKGETNSIYAYNIQIYELS